jgi:hypothetical protein
MKKRHKRAKSIFPQPEGECFLCARLEHFPIYHKHLEAHHIFFGCNHQQSDRYGFLVNLCAHHHRGDAEGDKDAVHSEDKNDYADYIRRWAQFEYEKTHTREEFIEIFGKSWL